MEYVDKVYNTGFETPIFLVNTKHEELPEEVLGKINHVIDGDPSEISKGLYDRGIEEAVVAFDDKVTPPFLKAMIKHVENGTFEYSCPGHHGGNFFRRTPTGARKASALELDIPERPAYIRVPVRIARSQPLFLLCPVSMGS